MPEPEAPDEAPVPDVEPVPVVVLPPVEVLVLSEDDEVSEPLVVDSVKEDSVSLAASSVDPGLRQNISHKMNQITPIIIRADTISQTMRPTVDGCLCSYICLASRVSYV